MCVYNIYIYMWVYNIYVYMCIYTYTNETG